MTSDCGKKRDLKIPLFAVVVCAILLCLSVAYVLQPGNAGAKTNFTMTCSPDGNLYYVDVNGDYAFEKYLETGSTSADELFDYLSDNVTCGERLAGFVPSGCSVFKVPDSTDGGYLAGRNFDYYDTIPGVVYTHGKGIYDSVSTVDLAMFSGVNATYSDMKADTRINAAAYLPMDGMNEKGVFVAINSVSGGPALVEEDESKNTIFITSSLRAVLDYSDSTQAAVELLNSYNLHSNADYHIFISDRSGYSCTVEVVDGKTYVTETDLLTNHYLTKEGSAPDVLVKESSELRYNTIHDRLSEKTSMTISDVKQLLIDVKQDDSDYIHYTRWSVIYDFDTLDVSIYIRVADGTDIDYNHSYDYNINGTGIVS